MPHDKPRRYQPYGVASAKKASLYKDTASSERCADSRNTDLSPVSFFKLIATVFMFLVVLSIPPGGSREYKIQCKPDNDVQCVAFKVYATLLHCVLRITEIVEFISGLLMKIFSIISHEISGLLYHTESMKNICCEKSSSCRKISTAYSDDATSGGNEVHQEMDKVIEDEITSKLSRDLAQSIEKKFHVDLEKSVNLVLDKIKMLLQNGTNHILERLTELQGQLEDIRKSTGTELDTCLKKRENQTTELAEKAMHQMVVCGYALIGHNPTLAVSSVVTMKNIIKTRLQPIRNQKKEIDELLKVCGHDHDSLKKVIKCVISKSTVVKSAMMDVTNQLLQGVVELTKVLAHGAMHEACLIEVIKTVEDEAFELVNTVRDCAFGNVTDEAAKYVEANNATVLDIPSKKSHKMKIDTNKKEVVEMKQLIRRMLSGANITYLDKRFKKKLKKLQADLASGETVVISNHNATLNANANDTNVDLNTTSLVSNVISNVI